jgi:hypothetical protein
MRTKYDGNWSQVREKMLADITNMITEALEKAVEELSSRAQFERPVPQPAPEQKDYFTVEERKVPALIPLTRWGEYFNDPSQGALRWMLHSNEAFRERVVVKRGRRILIDSVAYLGWLQQCGSATQRYRKRKLKTAEAARGESVA